MNLLPHTAARTLTFENNVSKAFIIDIKTGVYKLNFKHVTFTGRN